MIQACLVPDGQTKTVLVYDDTNECIEREMQTMKYQQADGAPIYGYSPIEKIVSSQVVDNDVCCKGGCEIPDFEGLLDACAVVTSHLNPPTYDLNAGFQICSSKTIQDDRYVFSTGELACQISHEVTHSTAFNDPDIVLQNCCDIAVEEYQDNTLTIDDVEKFCFKETVLLDSSKVQFDVTANDGYGQCNLLSGGF